MMNTNTKIEAHWDARQGIARELGCRLDRLYESARRRTRPAALSLAALSASEAKGVKKDDRVLSKVLELWRNKGLRVEWIASMSYRSGILTVRIPSASVLFEIDRDLRAGLTAETIRAVPGTLTRIKLVASAEPGGAA